MRSAPAPGVGLQDVLEADTLTGGWSSMTSAIDSGIAVKGMRPSRKRRPLPRSPRSRPPHRAAGREGTIGETDAREAVTGRERRNQGASSV